MTTPGRPGAIDAGDVIDATRKVHCIGADIAATLIRRCTTKGEAFDCLADAKTKISACFNKCHEAKPTGGNQNG